jgi:putative DNA primase/helicase
MFEDTTILDQKTERINNILEDIHPNTGNGLLSIFENKFFPKFNDFCPTTDSGENLGFKTALAAEWIYKTFNFKTDINTGILYFFNGKHWIPNAEPYLEILTSRILHEENKRSYYENILHNLTALSYCEITFSNKISFENCMLDVETLEVTPFNAVEMPLYYCPVKYDPDAKCPNWEAFISQVVDGDDVLTLQEWSGYLLLHDYRFHKLIWMQGEGRNGKGVWSRTMENILGKDNVSSVGLEELDGNHRFCVENLYGKLYNVCSEPTTNRILQTPLLKKLTGQDTLTAEIKGKQARLTFTNAAKITVMANKFPKVKDVTDAFKMRRLFLKFPHQFNGVDQVQNIERNWLEINDERSGILNWMLHGLQRLLRNGDFTVSQSQLEAEIAFQRYSDPFNAFLSEQVFYDKNIIVTRQEAYDAHKNYCDFYGLECESEKAFTARMKDTPKIGVCQTKGVRAWKGIGLKKLPDSEAETEKTVQETLTNTANTQNTPKIHDYNLDSKNKERKNGVFPVLGVLAPEASKVPESNILYYERLVPNDFHRCDGEGHGSQCPFEAEFKTENGFWCKTHLGNIAKNCSENGFVLTEKLAVNPFDKEGNN